MIVTKFKLFESTNNIVTQEDIEDMFLDIREEGNIHTKIEYMYGDINSRNRSNVQNIPLSNDYYPVCVVSLFDLNKPGNTLEKDEILNYSNDLSKIVRRLYNLDIISCKRNGNITQLIIKMSDSISDTYFSEMRKTLHSHINSDNSKLLMDFLKSIGMKRTYVGGYDIITIPKFAFDMKLVDADEYYPTATNYSRLKHHVDMGGKVGQVIFKLINATYNLSGYGNWITNRMPTHTINYISDNDMLEIKIDPKFRSEKV